MPLIRTKKLIRAVMESAAGARVRASGAAEGRTSFDQSLHELMRGPGAARYPPPRTEQF